MFMLRIVTAVLCITVIVPFFTHAKEIDMTDKMKKAVFAGGCFWCMEAEFEALDGVSDAVSGYTGGDASTADYDSVSQGGTGHREAVEVHYDPTKIDYDRLLSVYLDNVDPFDKDGQFCDKGFHYTPAIYTSDDATRAAASARLQAIHDKVGRSTAIALEDATEFFPAEDYHQDFHRKQRIRYTMYKNNCGRNERLDELKDML